MFITPKQPTGFPSTILSLTQHILNGTKEKLFYMELHSVQRNGEGKESRAPILHILSKTLEDFFESMGVTIHSAHDSIRITILGSRYDAHHDILNKMKT